MPTKRCARCGERKGSEAWTPFTWTSPTSAYCRECSAARHRERYSPKSGADDSPRECAWCGESYRPKQRRSSSFCSRACKDKERRASERAERLMSKPAERFCVHCAVAFPPSKRADAKFCSPGCNLSAHRLQRTLRRRTGSGMTGWLRASLFERDGWKCGICRRKVDPALRYPDPNAPSLDHIVPVADGGTNEPGNLRLTHLRCNCSRGRRGGNEQLAIT
jgi:hypothetical protein